MQLANAAAGGAIGIRITLLSGRSCLRKNRMPKVDLVCDNPKCKWGIEEDFDNVPNWHNQNCPACHKSVIVDDADMAIWKGVRVIMTIDEIIDPEKKLHRCNIKIDTAGLRANT